MPRIMLVANTAWSIFRFRHGLLVSLLKAGVEVVVVAPQDSSFADLQALGCSTLDLGLSAKGVNPFLELLLLFRLWRIYKKLQPDLIIHYTIKPNIYGSLAAKVAGIRSLAVTTGLGYTFVNDNVVARVARCLYRLAFRFPQEVWFLNADDRGEFLARRLVDDSRAILLPGEGIDLARFSPRVPVPSPDGRFRFLLIARMMWDKGVGEFVQAAQIVRRSYPNAVFQLLGACDVPNPSQIGIAQVETWVREGIVEYLGTTDDVCSAIARADCVVLPSYREGVPRTLMEAAAMAKPLIATDVPGCRDVVKDGINGFVCPMKNAEALADSCIRMLNATENDRQQMGLAGRQLMVEHFDEALVVSRYAEMLQRNNLNITLS